LWPPWPPSLATPLDASANEQKVSSDTAGERTFLVPAGITTTHIDAVGAKGEAIWATFTVPSRGRRGTVTFASGAVTCRPRASTRPLEHRRRTMHTKLQRGARRLAVQTAQGTVEYVALILLVALVMAGVVAAMKGFKTDEGMALGDAIIGKIKDAVQKVQF
jgi:hypothetical protein